MEIFCIACNKEVETRLTNGEEIYPHRPDLFDIPFWKCDTCQNYVGCHHKTNTPTRPLGCIATPEIFKMRSAIHAVIDPIWRSKKMPRGVIYARLGKVLGRRYHTGELRSMQEAEAILSAAKKIASSL